MKVITATVDRWNGKGFTSLILRCEDVKFARGVARLIGAELPFDRDWDFGEVNGGAQLRVWGKKQQCGNAIAVACALWGVVPQWNSV